MAVEYNVIFLMFYFLYGASESYSSLALGVYYPLNIQSLLGHYIYIYNFFQCCHLNTAI